MQKIRKPFQDMACNDSFVNFAMGNNMSIKAGTSGIGASSAALRHVPESIREVTIIHYDSWGNTDPVLQLPIQNNRPIDYNQLCRQLSRALHFRHQEKLIMSLLQSDLVRDFVSTAFWLHFLEHFALVDPGPYLEAYRKVEAQKAYEEQQAAMNHGVKPILTGAKKYQAANPKPGSPSSSIGGLKSKNGFSQPSKTERLRTKPRHLMHTREAGEVNRPKTLLTEEMLERNSRVLGMPGSKASTIERKTDAGVVLTAKELARLDGAGSEKSVHSGRKNGRASSPAKSDRSETYTIVSMGSTTRSSRTEIEPGEGMYQGAVGGDAISSYRGPKDILAIGDLLLDAELIDEPLPTDPTNVPRDLGKQLEIEAITLIREEQDRIIGRLSIQYVQIMQTFSIQEKDAFMPLFPDVCSNLIVQILNRVLPYCKTELLTSSVKQDIKKVMTFWIHGVESSDVSQWEIDPKKKKQMEEKKKAQKELLEEKRIPNHLKGFMTNRTENLQQSPRKLHDGTATKNAISSSREGVKEHPVPVEDAPSGSPLTAVTSAAIGLEGTSPSLVASHDVDETSSGAHPGKNPPSRPSTQGSGSKHPSTSGGTMMPPRPPTGPKRTSLVGSSSAHSAGAGRTSTQTTKRLSGTVRARGSGEHDIRLPSLNGRPSGQSGVSSSVTNQQKEISAKHGWKVAKTTATMARAGLTISQGVGEQVYVKGLEEMRQAFEDMRRANRISDLGGIASARNAGEDDARFSAHQMSGGKHPTGSSWGGQRGMRNMGTLHPKPLDKHAYFHRHAPSKKKAFWNELGKPKGPQIGLGINFKFSLQDLSPLMSRYYKDNDLETTRLGPTSLIGWSL